MRAFPAKNAGNSCYANIILQLIRTCDDVTESLARHKCRVHGKKSPASGQVFACILCLLREDFATTTPKVPNICQQIGRFDGGGIRFSDGGQEDAHEFLGGLERKTSSKL